MPVYLNEQTSEHAEQGKGMVTRNVTSNAVVLLRIKDGAGGIVKLGALVS